MASLSASLHLSNLGMRVGRDQWGNPEFCRWTSPKMALRVTLRRSASWEALSGASGPAANRFECVRGHRAASADKGARVAPPRSRHRFRHGESQESPPKNRFLNEAPLACSEPVGDAR